MTFSGKTWAAGEALGAEHRTDHNALADWMTGQAVNVVEYGAVGDGTTDDAAAIQAAVDAADAANTPVLIPAECAISEPIVLPRTGNTSPLTNIVQLVGLGPYTSGLKGTAGFPEGRALIEWEASTERAWHQRIAGLRLVLPDKDARAVHFAKQGAGTTADDYLAETLQISMENVLIDANSLYHTELIRLEAAVRFSLFRDVWGNPSNGGLDRWYGTLNDPYLFVFETLSAFSAADSGGLNYSLIEDCGGQKRRGGRMALLKGRVHASEIRQTFSDSGHSAGDLHIQNGHSVRIVGARNEGRSAPQIIVEDSANVTAEGIGLATPDPLYPDWEASTAYALNEGVVVPGWSDNQTEAAPTNINWYKATVAGTSGSSEPSWPTVAGNTVTDGGVTWECMGAAVSDAVTFTGCTDIRVDVSSSTGKPNHSSRGVFALVIDGCTHVQLSGSVPGPVADDVSIADSTLVYGRLRSVRDGTATTYDGS